MGLLEFIFGWKLVNEKDIHPNMIRTIDKKLKLKREKQIKKMKHFNLGRNSRGRRITPDYPSIVIYVKGSTFRYKAKDSAGHYFDNQGHGGYMSSGRKIYRKIK